MEQPDTTEKVIRFGCGSIVGALLVGVFWAVMFADTLNEVILSIAFPAVVFGIAALVLGDRFWNALRKWWWWT